ncbi:MAG: 30S ribosomal protein S12 methylthiotransferase RimO [Lachnospiraceae bacterium]|nr:30S ribosomal protein S12 methylthiotransferase RimO [Lachnospiraceae bacterium]
MKLLLVSLGCDKNLVDSEEMTGILAEQGFEFTDDEKKAEVIIVNTCAFIGDAKEESINTILDLAENRIEAGNGGVCRALIATGCLAQRYSEEIKKELPEIDAVIGTMAYDRIGEVINSVLSGKVFDAFSDIDSSPEISGRRFPSSGGHYAFLKIAEGCDKRCTYCIIPFMRGRYRSFPEEELLKEAERLAFLGVKELILVAQETTVYGVDLYGKKALPELLKGLARIDGIEWIRLMYCYPEEITDELIETIRTEPKICDYLDIPIQHSSDKILKAMGRKTDEKSLRTLIEKLRREIPDIALRTTLIAGFPGETEEDFEKLYNFCDELEFDRLGVFPYSEEEGTRASTLPGKVPEEEKLRRRDELMELSREIVFEKAEKQVGRKLSVFIEGFMPEENIYVGRTYMDAPEVDGMIFVHSDRELLSGMIVNVRVTEAKGYDLIGEEIYESA